MINLRLFYPRAPIGERRSIPSETGRVRLLLQFAFVAIAGSSSVTAEVLVSQWGGFGAGDGQFFSPAGIAVESNRVYVVDQFNRRVQVFDRTGVLILKWGTFGSADGQFNLPFGIAVQGNEVYVTDQSNCNVQVFDRNGGFLRKWGSPGSADGQFASPNGIAVQGGEVYIADGPGNLVHVFSQSGVFLRKWTWRPVTIPPFEHSSPTFVAVAGDDVYVAGQTSVIGGGARLRLFNRDGILLRFWIDRNQSARGVAVHGNTIYLASDSSVLVIDRGSTQQFGFPGFTGGQFFSPLGLAVQANEIYVTDVSNHRVLVFRKD